VSHIDLVRSGRAARLYTDLADTLTPEMFGSRLGDLPSNTIADQLWCVVGARESYARAARDGGWKGFASSLNLESAHETQHHGQLIRCLYGLGIPRPASWRERYALD
jgi:hypothetical protein